MTTLATAKSSKLLEDVKKALSKGTIEVDSEGRVVTEEDADDKPEQTARHSRLSKERRWY